ncbi:protein kinase domain-containing protein [Streptomyces sp. 2A115]|uniref:protein kinase domain-containing protein n=1 Tax=Streptomyces sp. 2A115 TaxID=3457439 RepID=UPI003FCF1E46
MPPDLAKSEAAALRQTGTSPLRTGDPSRVGPYVPLALLGSGGMGRVFLARPADDSPGLVAAKVIRPEYADDATFRRRFEREASVHARIRTPQTPRLCGTGFQDELLWMATEYLPGLDLAAAVREDGALEVAAVWRLVAELGRALADLAAAGIVHRDLKPSNVLLSARGAHVIDFGISKAADASAITGTGNRVGTPAYMSPEHLRTGKSDTASDVFSLAGTLVYAAAGSAPFGDGTGVDVMHRVAFEEPDPELLGEISAADAALGSLLSACLTKEPERRPTAQDLIDAAGAHTGTSSWPEPLGGRVLARQRAYEVLHRLPVERRARFRPPEGQSSDARFPDRQSPDGPSSDARFPNAQSPDGPPSDARFPNGQFPGARFPDSPSSNAQFPNGQFPDSPSSNAQFPNGQLPDSPSSNAQSPDSPSSNAQSPGDRSADDQSPDDWSTGAQSADNGPPDDRPEAVPPAPPRQVSRPAPPGFGPPVEAASPSAVTPPARSRPAGGRTWARKKPVLAVSAGITVCAVAAVVFVLARQDAPASAASPEAGATSTATGTVPGDATLSPVPGTSEGLSAPHTSGKTADGGTGPDDDASRPEDSRPAAADDVRGNDPSPPGIEPSDPADATPSPSSPPSDEPAAQPWISDCTHYSGNGRTSQGDSGKRVLQVQCMLTKRGYGVGNSGVDGTFRPETESAVRSFQSAKGLNADGVVDRETWVALRSSD